jgi:hypothetical protein
MQGTDTAVHARSIGPLGTAARAAVGAVFLFLGIVGLPPFHLLPWWQILIGLAAVPAVAVLFQIARTAITNRRLNETGGVATGANCLIFAAFLLFPPTRGITFVFLGASMLLAAVRGYAGCESLAVSNWVLRRDDQIGCMLFSPVDAYELRLRSGGTVR